jgi:prolipoprotein diacylglyceryl transferase
MNAIPILIDPVAVQLGPIVLAWHGIFTAVGVLIGLYLAAWLAPTVGLTDEVVWASAWWVLIGGIIGARLLFAAEHPALFVDQPWRLLLINEGGISVFGAVIGGMAGGAVFARRQRISAARLLDVVAPGFLLGQGIGRIGDIINGEHLGVPAPGLPWAVVYLHPNTLGEIGVPVHPAVAYEMIWDLAAAGLLVVLLKNWHLPPGVSMSLGLLLYGLGRFWVGFYRLDQNVLGPLGLAQLIGLVVLPVGLFGLWLALRKHGEPAVNVSSTPPTTPSAPPPAPPPATRQPT